MLALGSVLALGCSLKELACHLASLENDKLAAAVCNEFIRPDQSAGPWHRPSLGRAEHPPKPRGMGLRPDLSGV